MTLKSTLELEVCLMQDNSLQEIASNMESFVGYFFDLFGFFLSHALYSVVYSIVFYNVKFCTAAVCPILCFQLMPLCFRRWEEQVNPQPSPSTYLYSSELLCTLVYSSVSDYSLISLYLSVL